MDIRIRNTEAEWMDDPNIGKDALKDVLGDVNRVNRLLGGNGITIKALGQLIKKHPREQYTILDVGCGDGNMLRTVSHYCRNHRIRANLIGIDLSEQALAIAREKSTDYEGIQYHRQDIVNFPQSHLRYDILLCTLTMHHFPSSQIPLFLKSFVAKASIGMVINDLQRSILAYYLFKGFSAIFIRTAIARRDGLISIGSGFTRGELNQFAKGLPNVQHKIRWKWAFRYVWVMYAHPLKQTNE